MRVAVTSWAWRTPLGASVDRACDRWLAQERAGVPNPLGDSYACRQVAPIPDPPAPSRNQRYVSAIALHGIEVAREACRGVSPVMPGERVGLFAGSGGLRSGLERLMPAMHAQRDDAAGSWSHGFRALHPLWMLRYLSNNAHGIIAAELGIEGEGICAAGPVAGAEAVIAAVRSLAAGAIDRALVVAYDTLLAPEVLVEIGERDPGAVAGEAAAALVIERAGAQKALAHIIVRTGAVIGNDRDEAFTRVVAPLRRDGDVIDGDAPGSLAAASGRLGAAKPLVQVIALATCLRRGVHGDARRAVCISGGAPAQLLAAVAVEVM